jgi:hypothetical protein
VYDRLALALAVLPLLAGCRDAVERRAAEVASLREDAAAGIDAVEAFCTARDSAIAAAERGDEGAERVLQEVLLARVVIDDYCEEFRYHSHDEHDPADPPSDTGPAANRPDSAARDTVDRDGGE